MERTSPGLLCVEIRLLASWWRSSMIRFPISHLRQRVEWAEKFKAAFQQIGDYFRTNNVRVVNMSWGDDVSEFEQWLTKTSARKTRQSENKPRRPFTKFGTRRWRTRFGALPTPCLYVPQETPIAMPDSPAEVPAALHLPNLIAVGAVDQAGEETSFTSYGDTVVVDADGYEVESYVPGGSKHEDVRHVDGFSERCKPGRKTDCARPVSYPAADIALIKKAQTGAPTGGGI